MRTRVLAVKQKDTFLGCQVLENKTWVSPFSCTLPHVANTVHPSEEEKINRGELTSGVTFLCHKTIRQMLERLLSWQNICLVKPKEQNLITRTHKEIRK